MARASPVGPSYRRPTRGGQPAPATTTTVEPCSPGVGQGSELRMPDPLGGIPRRRHSETVEGLSLARCHQDHARPVRPPAAGGGGRGRRSARCPLGTSARWNYPAGRRGPAQPRQQPIGSPGGEGGAHVGCRRSLRVPPNSVGSSDLCALSELRRLRDRAELPAAQVHSRRAGPTISRRRSSSCDGEYGAAPAPVGGADSSTTWASTSRPRSGSFSGGGTTTAGTCSPGRKSACGATAATRSGCRGSRARRTPTACVVHRRLHRTRRKASRRAASRRCTTSSEPRRVSHRPVATHLLVKPC